MPRFIIKLTKKTKKESNDYYFMWSTIVDAPVSMNMGEGAALQYLKQNLSPEDYKESVKSLKENGVSSPHYDMRDIIDTNDLDCGTYEDLVNELCV
jgi:hypothetical protein